MIIFWSLEEPQAAVSPPQKKLECGGEACPKCDKCRDWYHEKGQNYDWKLRDGATCNPNNAPTYRGYYYHYRPCDCK